MRTLSTVHLPLLVLALGTLACHRRGGVPVPGPLDAMRYNAAEPPSRRTPERPPRPRPVTTDPQGIGKAVAEQAALFVSTSALEVDGERYRYDCSGMVSAAYAGVGQILRGSSRDLYELAENTAVLHEQPRPFPGDVVFFDNTYDRDRNGQRDDDLTHVGVVETVAADGTITVVHLGSGGVGRLRMNLEHPQDPALNSALRAVGDRDGGPVLAGELWRGFGSLWALPESQRE